MPHQYNLTEEPFVFLGLPPFFDRPDRQAGEKRFPTLEKRSGLLRNHETEKIGGKVQNAGLKKTACFNRFS